MNFTSDLLNITHQSHKFKKWFQKSFFKKKKILSQILNLNTYFVIDLIIMQEEIRMKKAKF